MKPALFLGGGRITSALIAGLRLAGDKGRIVVYDRNPGKLRALQRQSPMEIARDLSSAIKQSEMVIVAVRPASMPGLLSELRDSNLQIGLCISLAAGIPLRVLRRSLGPPARWVRAMPSPVCRIGRGLTALRFDRTVTKAERIRVSRFFATVGQVIEIPEREFDAFTAAYSSSHGYHALAALAKAAQNAGLNQQTALVAAAHGLGDGILYWRESGDALASLLHEAATPGGIAAATMRAMDKAGYVRAIRKGLSEGIKTARRNAGLVPEPTISTSILRKPK